MSNYRFWEAEAGGSCVPGQPGLYSETLSFKKIKRKKMFKGRGYRAGGRTGKSKVFMEW
jgi:hypothetical protein